MSELPNEIVIRAKPVGHHWEVAVEMDGNVVGSGTGPHAEDMLGISADVLFGDTNDHLNDYHGALGQIIKDEKSVAGR